MNDLKLQPNGASSGNSGNTRSTLRRVTFSILGALVLTFIVYVIKHYIDFANPISHEVVMKLDEAYLSAVYYYQTLIVLIISFILFALLLFWNKVYSYVLVAVIMLLGIFPLNLMHWNMYRQYSALQNQYNQHVAAYQQQIANETLSPELSTKYFIPEVKGTYINNQGQTTPIDLVIHSATTDSSKYSAQYILPENPADTYVFVDITTFSSSNLAQQSLKGDLVDISGNKVYVSDYATNEMNSGLAGLIQWASGNYSIKTVLALPKNYDPKNPNNMEDLQLVKDYLTKYPSSLK